MASLPRGMHEGGKMDGWPTTRGWVHQPITSTVLEVEVEPRTKWDEHDGIMIAKVRYTGREGNPVTGEVTEVQGVWREWWWCPVDDILEADTFEG